MDLAFTNPGHNREGPKQTPDTLHTLSRHPTDTPQTPSRQLKLHDLQYFLSVFIPCQLDFSQWIRHLYTLDIIKKVQNTLQTPNPTDTLTDTPTETFQTAKII